MQFQSQKDQQSKENLMTITTRTIDNEALNVWRAMDNEALQGVMARYQPLYIHIAGVAGRTAAQVRHWAPIVAYWAVVAVCYVWIWIKRGASMAYGSRWFAVGVSTLALTIAIIGLVVLYYVPLAWDWFRDELADAFPPAEVLAR